MKKDVSITMNINGIDHKAVVDPNAKLSGLLRTLGFLSVKEGCHEGICGACAVNLNGRVVNACMVYAVQADRSKIETVEFFGSLDHPHPLQEALVEEGAVQCGFCMPGLIVSAKALFDQNPSPSEDEMKEYLDGHLCRCTGYEKIQTALRRVARAGKGERS